MTIAVTLLTSLLPALLVPHAPIAPAPAHTSRAVAIRACEAAPSSSTAADQLTPAHTWRRKARSAGQALVLAAALAVPRGPARAAQLPPGGGASAPMSSEAPPTVKKQRKQQQKQLAFLGFRKKKTLREPLARGKLRANEIDMDAIVSKKTARRFTEREFIFSEGLTRRGDLEEELAELDEVKSDRAFERVASTVGLYGVAAGGIYFTVQGARGIERWMKQQELNDIEEERELTGEYISVDAGDVETSIDPLTGKNLTIVKREAPKNAGGNATVVEDESSTPWILKVLGMGGTKAADDDDFWAPPTAASAPRKSPDSGSGGGAAPAADGSGGAEDGSEGGGGDGVEDDTTDIDSLGDLLG